MTDAFRFESVQPLIAQVASEGRELSVRFTCPASGRSVEAYWKAPSVGVSGLAAAEAHTTLYQVRRQVNGLVRGLLGYGHAGRAARLLADATLAGTHPSTQLSTDEEERGIVAAFRSVSAQFAWIGSRWVHASEVGQDPDPLRTSIANELALTGWDREVAARMVVAVARAHGGISDEERLHLLDAFDGDVGSLDALSARPPLTAAELQQTTGSKRLSILKIAWSMALCDEQFDDAEGAVLERFGRQLGLSLEERVEAQRQAQMYVLDQFMEQMLQFGSHDAASRTQLYALAERIGVSEGAVQRAEARFLRRRA
jgi:tellurite resistance protein